MSSQQSWWRSEEGTEPSESTSSPPPVQSTMQIPEDGPNEQLRTRRIHIVGLGSIGTFVAHSLQCLPNPPPITLVMHRPGVYEDFKATRRTVRLINKKNQINDAQTGFDVDLAETDSATGSTYWRHISHEGENKKPVHPPSVDEILPSGEVYMHSVIVTVKSKDTVPALRSLKHRINAETTICLMQNGMGQVEELNEKLFTNPATRPTYMLGIVSHGVHLAIQLVAIHAGFGTIALGVVRDLDKYPLPPKTPSPTSSSPSRLSESERKRLYPTDADLYSNISSRYLLRQLTRSPVLACAAFPYLDLFQLQLEKLSINAVLNPTTALLDIPNGATIDNTAITRVARLLLAEISLVLRSLPELDGVPGVRARFSPQRLETLYRAVAAKTAENSSSMREDVRRARETEIDHINGYVVRRGEQLGLKCVLNYLLMQLVQAKTWHARAQDGAALPLSLLLPDDGGGDVDAAAALAAGAADAVRSAGSDGRIILKDGEATTPR